MTDDVAVVTCGENMLTGLPLDADAPDDGVRRAGRRAGSRDQRLPAYAARLADAGCTTRRPVLTREAEVEP